MKLVLRTVIGIALASAIVGILLAPEPIPGQQPTQQYERPLVLTTGGDKGTYFRLANEITQVCNEPALQIQVSSGSTQNIERLIGNEANVGIVQADTLVAKKFIDNDPEVDNIRSLLVLYPEDAHFIVKTDNRYIGSFTQLGNKKVVSFGGGMTTGKVIFAKTGVRPITFDDAGNFDNAKTMLDQNKADAVPAVGGQPLGTIKALNQNYRLLAFEPYERVKDAYQRSVLNYTNLNQTGIQSVATQAILVTMDYKSPALVRRVASLRKCIVDHLVDLRETVGTHSAWRRIDPKEKGFWPTFDTGAAEPATVAPRKK